MHEVTAARPGMPHTLGDIGNCCMVDLCEDDTQYNQVLPRGTVAECRTLVLLSGHMTLTRLTGPAAGGR